MKKGIVKNLIGSPYKWASSRHWHSEHDRDSAMAFEKEVNNNLLEIRKLIEKSGLVETPSSKVEQDGCGQPIFVDNGVILAPKDRIDKERQYTNTLQQLANAKRDLALAHAANNEYYSEIIKAIRILDGNEDPIDWRNGSGSELLLKLCEHLEVFRKYEKGLLD